MPNEVLVKVGGQIRFCVTASLASSDSATSWKIGTPTDCSLTLASVANGAGRQSNKVDLGATRARRYECLGCVDFTGETPTAGGTIDYYWAPSTSATVGTGNVAGNSGVDAAAPGGALGSITLAEFILQCVFIGSLVVHDGAIVQNGIVGTFSPSGRYGQLVVVNNSGGAFEANDSEMHQVLNPIIDEGQ